MSCGDFLPCSAHIEYIGTQAAKSEAFLLELSMQHLVPDVGVKATKSRCCLAAVFSINQAIELCQNRKAVLKMFGAVLYVPELHRYGRSLQISGESV